MYWHIRARSRMMGIPAWVHGGMDASLLGRNLVHHCTGMDLRVVGALVQGFRDDVGFRDSGGSMSRYMDAQICGCRMQWCKDVEKMYGFRDTGRSMPCS
jgi:hypothetical protein